MNNYYVYEWINFKTFEPIYIGKGQNNRCYNLHRQNNDKLIEYLNDNDVISVILENNLTETEAFEYEVYYINLYKDIYGYDLYNIQDGGKGHGILGNKSPGFTGKKHTDKYKNKMSEMQKGENNTMYNRPWWDKNTPIEKINQWKEKISKANSGLNNYMYGKHLSDERKSKLRKSSPKAMKVELYDINKNLISTFDSLRHAEIFFIEKGIKINRHKIKKISEQNILFNNYYLKVI